MKIGKYARWRVPPVLVLCALALSCAGSHRGPAPAPETQQATADRPAPGVEPSGIVHVVLPGETLWRIARTYGVDVDELAEANAITDPAVLDAGRRLFVPGAIEKLQVPAVTGTPAPAGLRFLWPVPHGRVLSYYGAARRGHRHAGIDIGANRGRPVIAALAGRVTYAGSTMRGYGKTVIIEHGDRYSSLYAHNSRLLVRVGDWVDVGQTIAQIGRSGNASTDHCHFEIRRRGVAVDPLPYLQEREERY